MTLQVIIDEFTWAYMQFAGIAFLVTLIGCMALLGFLGWYVFWHVPRDAKILARAKSKRRGIFDITRDDGMSHYELASKIYPNGIAKTDKKTWKWFPSPMPESGNLDSANKGLFERVKQVFTKRSILESCGVPLWRCYSAGFVAVSSAALMTLEYAPEKADADGKVSRKLSLPFKINVERTKKIEGNERLIPVVEGGLDETTQVEILFPLDAKTAYDAVPQVWGQSQGRAMEIAIHDFEQAKLKKQKESVVVILGLAVCVVGIICATALSIHFL